MMLAYRLSAWSRPTPTQNVLAEDLRDRVEDMHSHLGGWLLGKTSFDIEQREQEIGARRVHQSVPISGNLSITMSE
jgi:hypothetical protein